MTPTIIASEKIKELEIIGGRAIVSVSLDMYDLWKEDIEMYANKKNLKQQLQDSIDSGIGSLKI